MHLSYMERAISLAKRGRGNTSPNPMVGCILVKDGRIIGEGFHEKYGGLHAEEMAIKNSYISPEGSTAYINLEPCCIESKTSPCTKLLIENGIKEVFISMLDPNPKISGEGIRILKEYGIKINLGLLENVSKELNKGFIKWITQCRPWVIAKVAQTQNGFMAINRSTQFWITGKEAKVNNHKLRSKVDAILIGRQTAFIDNPQLTVRKINAKNPIRVILDTNRILPLTLNIFRDNKAETIVLCSIKQFYKSRTSFCKYIPVKEENKKLSVDHILLKLAREGITSLLIEGGEKVFSSFFKEDLIDEIYLYTSPNKIQNAAIKNPIYINKDWSIIDQLKIGSDSLIIAKKKEKCLQEL